MYIIQDYIPTQIIFINVPSRLNTPRHIGTNWYCQYNIGYTQVHLRVGKSDLYEQKWLFGCWEIMVYALGNEYSNQFQEWIVIKN